MYKGYIYKWENKINNKVYIGQTMNRYGYKERWSQHRYQAENNMHNNKFHNAIRKYGIDNFDKKVLKCIEMDDKVELKKALDEIEVKYIEKYDSFNNGYNSTLGGDFNSWNSSYNFNREEHILKVKESKCRNEIYKSIKIRTDLKLSDNFDDMLNLYNDMDIRYSKYRYKYKPINKGVSKINQRDFYSPGKGKWYNIKLYSLENMNAKDLENYLYVDNKLNIYDLDFMDKEVVKSLLTLDTTNLFYEYDIETIWAIKELYKNIKYVKFTKRQAEVLKLLRKGLSQTRIAEILGISQSSVNYAIDKIVNNIIKEYEEQYEDWYYLNIRKGQYKKCKKCGEIKLVQRFHKNGEKRFKSNCKCCINKNS